MLEQYLPRRNTKWCEPADGIDEHKNKKKESQQQHGKKNNWIVCEWGKNALRSVSKDGQTPVHARVYWIHDRASQSAKEKKKNEMFEPKMKSRHRESSAQQIEQYESQISARTALLDASRVYAAYS